MIKLIALADTHLDGELPKWLAELAGEADIMAHAGDFVAGEIYADLAELVRIEAVHGNADPTELRMRLPDKKSFEVEGINIGLIHRASHFSDPIGASMQAREMGVDLLIFGHMHRPYLEQKKSILLCPGSPTAPRMSAPTVAEMEIDGGQISGRIRILGKPSCDYLKFAESLAEKKI